MSKSANGILLGSFEAHEGDIPEYALGRPTFETRRSADYKHVKQTKSPCNRIRITESNGRSYFRTTTKLKTRNHVRAMLGKPALKAR